MRSNSFGAGGVVVAAALTAALGLSACSSTPSTASVSTLGLGQPNYITLAPTLSTVALVVSDDPLPGTKIPEQSSYVIQEGDYPSTVAHKFGVVFNDLMALNEWTLDENGIVPEWPGVGQTIKIPAGATVPEPDGSPGTPTEDPSQPTVAATPTTKPPPTTEKLCTREETYTIAAGDAPSNVAARFNTTINDLNRANGGTKGYAQFVIGTVIKIPDRTLNC